MVILAEKMRQKLLSGSSSQADATNDEMGSKEEMQDWLLRVGKGQRLHLVSFVKSSNNPKNFKSSLLGDWHRINVTLTRAKIVTIFLVQQEHLEMADEEMADEEQQKGKRTIRKVHGFINDTWFDISYGHSRECCSFNKEWHIGSFQNFRSAFWSTFIIRGVWTLVPYVSPSYKVARGAVIISSGDTKKLLDISVNLARTFCKTRFNGLTPYGRIVGDSGLEGLKVGQSRIEFGQILACGYNHTVLPQYKRMPSRAGTNSVDSEDDSGKSLTFIYHDSGISLATRVFMMLKMSLHYSLRVFAG
ncbi:Vacuolar protein sorting-associated protein 36 [Artemisia annua]|uniref:Vacuolar protein sorting-associated protein 36 n=1 Tax=Artemisia annua TaxID=35608 RepID=A0A2U1LR18_ARTAN|nr:Vacuolar protein sorting-associated protein 36 [Artemisia annua]